MILKNEKIKTGGGVNLDLLSPIFSSTKVVSLSFLMPDIDI
jgi:hypothetical protein